MDGHPPGGRGRGAAEALRSLIHLTLAAPSPAVPRWEDVSDIYRVLGELRVLAARLAQGCDQLAMRLQRLGDRAAWCADDGTSQYPNEVVATAIEGLQVAGCIAEEVGPEHPTGPLLGRPPVPVEAEGKAWRRRRQAFVSRLVSSEVRRSSRRPVRPAGPHCVGDGRLMAFGSRPSGSLASRIHPLRRR